MAKETETTETATTWTIIFTSIVIIAVLGLLLILHANIRDNRAAIRENSSATSKLSAEVGSLSVQMGSLSTQVDSFTVLTKERYELRAGIVKSQAPVNKGKSPISLNATGQRLADALKVPEFIKDNYDLIVANRPKDSNKLDIQGWSRSGDAAQVMREILGDDGADNIKNVIFDEGLDIDSDIAVEYVVREIYGIVLRDMIFEKELK